MPVDRSLAGRTFPVTAPYQVCEQQIRAFATATGSTYDTNAAPSTFPIVVAFTAMQALMNNPDVGIALHRVVHGDQRFVHTRPVVAGDQLTAQLTVDSLRQIGGADIIGTRSEISDTDGAHVCTAFATLVHRGES